MSSRDDILKSIRKNLPQAAPLPDLSGNWIEYDDPIAQFRSVLESIGGELIEVQNASQIATAFEDDLLAEGNTIVSCVANVLEDRTNISHITDPHDLEDVHLAVLPGEIAVAENAAIWVTDEHVPLRVLFFITQHLSLVVRRDRVVSNMMQAYDRIDSAKLPFGTFIAGPSKTADIEQALVKGAHGARTLKVFLVEDL